jgi:hypothetical protein
MKWHKVRIGWVGGDFVTNKLGAIKSTDLD